MDNILDVSLEEIEKIIGKVCPFVLKHQKEAGKPAGVTGEIAELEAARILGLKICCPRQAGYDALRVQDEKVVARIVIKSKCLTDSGELDGGLGEIDLDKEWDSVLFVVLDEKLEAFAIYEAQRKDIKLAVTRFGNERGALSAQQFKSISALIWSRA